LRMFWISLVGWQDKDSWRLWRIDYLTRSESP
jgi:hypothetical protein